MKNSSNWARDPVVPRSTLERLPNSRLDIVDAERFVGRRGRYLRGLVTSGWAGAKRMPAPASPLGSNGTGTVVLAVWVNAEMAGARAT